MTNDSHSRQRMRDGSRLRDIASAHQSDAHKTGGEPSPRSTYEAVTRQMVHALRDEVRDVKHRINQLITLIIAAILLEVVLRLVGV